MKQQMTRAQTLGFSWAAPRTRSSFILKEDRPSPPTVQEATSIVFSAGTPSWLRCGRCLMIQEGGECESPALEE